MHILVSPPTARVYVYLTIDEADEDEVIRRMQGAGWRAIRLAGGSSQGKNIIECWRAHDASVSNEVRNAIVQALSREEGKTC